MANYDASYNPSADPAFDKAPFTGEDAADVAAADTSAETIAQGSRDAERTDSHEHPSKCTRTPMTFRWDMTNEGLLQLRFILC